MTALVAGHETTASELAWAFEALAREPQVLGRLHAEIDAGEDDAYLTATIQETLRRRPVLPQAEPRLVKQPIEIGGWRYEPGVVLAASAWLVHHDPEIYPDPFAFRPERFLEQPPGTYTWIPFGGGRRRCLGASFAMLEMKVSLRAALRRFTIAPAGEPERTRRRAITISPRLGALTVLRPREGILGRPRGHGGGRPRARSGRLSASPPRLGTPIRRRGRASTLGRMGADPTPTTAHEQELLETARGGGRGRLSTARGAAPGRAPQPLLPHARVGPRRRGRPPGRAAAGLARATALRGSQLASLVALQHRHQHLPGRDRAAAQAGSCRSTRPPRPIPTLDPASR